MELIIINAVIFAGDVHLFLDIAHQNGKCIFFTCTAADSIMACVFHSADDVGVMHFIFLLFLHLDYSEKKREPECFSYISYQIHPILLKFGR